MLLLALATPALADPPVAAPAPVKTTTMAPAKATTMAPAKATTMAPATGIPPATKGSATATPPAPLRLPADGAPINVAFLIADRAVVMDFAGPWSVFEYAHGGRFRLYTVAAHKQPLRVSGGLQVLPDFTFADAPPPDVIVVPAQSSPGPDTLAWLREAAAHSALTMSVCSGAFVLAQAGLLDGQEATLYHDDFDAFAKAYPRVKVRRGVRFVEEGRLATAAGLSSGIDLALRVVERYYGHTAAEETAYDLEYQGRGWLDAASNAAYTSERPGLETDPVCHMKVDAKTAVAAQYRGRTYYFCDASEKDAFVAQPERYLR